jgi:23S rRNA (cytidine1920-2'-O)/16S rRNA (cytidine1409-2'-O)-methyltransferase
MQSIISINLKDRICIDIGASTGGFCDCMLQKGAKEVWCVDVGYNQMDWKLKTDSRVHNIEKTNARNCAFEDVFKTEQLPQSDMPTFLSMDLSFISIKKVLPNVLNFTAENSEFVLLVKPQFEAEATEVLKGGLVKDEKIHKRILDDIQNFAKTLSLVPQGFVPSPIAGNKSGNTEYLLYLKKGEI